MSEILTTEKVGFFNQQDQFREHRACFPPNIRKTHLLCLTAIDIAARFFSWES